ncbi:GNAT family N-acetyltransferase [uncultured Tateyamaria sp.]|uniref:GNAT family N-acetyltransferase n=1 Tax=uncultured Tateyamaria sp. TaxID=455651 RepID=UPI00261AA44C|nr:GNAT family N-acetyltransferase [uncultured Tateyamaria sp.]
MTIRQANLDDIETLTELTEEFVATMPPGFPYQRSAWSVFLENSINSPDSLVLVQDNGGGLIVGSLFQNAFSGTLCANEVLWYTRPQYRGTGMKLLFSFRDWAREKQAFYIYLSLAQESPALEKLGFLHTQETCYMARFEPDLGQFVAY